MAVIFTASGDTESANHSSRILRPLLHWLFPRMSDAQIMDVVLVARKGAHVCEYAVLAMLLGGALRAGLRGPRKPWRWSQAWLAVGLAAAYAVTDEIHQSFVPNRQGAPVDVLIDTTGATLGIVFLWAVGHWRKKW